jgi:hypothetical protein
MREMAGKRRLLREALPELVAVLEEGLRRDGREDLVPQLGELELYDCWFERDFATIDTAPSEIVKRAPQDGDDFVWAGAARLELRSGRIAQIDLLKVETLRPALRRVCRRIAR